MVTNKFSVLSFQTRAHFPNSQSLFQAWQRWLIRLLQHKGLRVLFVSTVYICSTDVSITFAHEKLENRNPIVIFIFLSIKHQLLDDNTHPTQSSLATSHSQLTSTTELPSLHVSSGQTERVEHGGAGRENLQPYPCFLLLQ